VEEAPRGHQGSQFEMGNHSCYYSSCYDMEKSSSGSGAKAGSASSTIAKSGDDDNSDLAENKTQEQEPPVYPSDRQPCGRDESYYTDFHLSKSSGSNFEGASDREARCEQAILRQMSGSCTREEAEDPALGTHSRES
jgi:hypothetical protein